MESRLRHLPTSLLLLGLLSSPLSSGCSSSESGAGTGGTVGSGGVLGSGGSTSTGGSTGGQVASGGRVATGGIVGSGGTTGGVTASGGMASGATAAGGASTGGSQGGTPGGSPTGGATTGGTSTAGSNTGGSGMAGSGTAGAAGSSTAGSGGGGSGGAQGKGSPGCGSSEPLKSGNNFTETIDGTSRKWMLDVPSGYDANKPYRLVFVWHPLGGSGSQVVSGGYNGLKALSNNTAIFATADGLNGSNAEASGPGWWNANGGDMKLFKAMLDKINAGLCVDQERIFSTGFSFGGMMSYTLPFEFDVFRAVAPCSGKTGVIPFEEKFTRPVPIMAFHGDSDTFVATNLGKAFLDKFAARNKCGTQTQPVSPNGCVQYQGCEATTIWCLFQGGHTTWSEEPQAIWKFFSGF